MKIFIDFDDVLFNTTSFIKEIKEIFNNHGISSEKFQESYISYPQKDKSGKLKKYDIRKHILILEKELKQNFSLLKQSVENLMKDTSRFIFKDVESFLIKLNNKGLYLVSYGANQYQKDKIYHSGISSYFKKIKIVDKLKAEAIQAIIKQSYINDEKIYFLDDRIEQVDNMKKIFPL